MRYQRTGNPPRDRDEEAKQRLAQTKGGMSI